MQFTPGTFILMTTKKQNTLCTMKQVTICVFYALLNFFPKGFFVMDYFVSFGDSDEPALPFSTVQVGGMFGDFYCNFTDVEVIHIMYINPIITKFTA